MKKLFLSVICLMAVSLSASAQNKARSLIIGFGPVGYIHENIKLDDEKYKYDPIKIVLPKIRESVL